MSFTTGNDINILQGTDLGVVDSGAGNDRYVLDASTLTANQRITISDAAGANTLQLNGGLVITSSSATGDSLQLTLNNGAVITVLGASTFSFQTGGNVLSGTGGTTETFSTFLTASLGYATAPTGTTPVNGGTKTVNVNGGTGPATNPVVVGQAFTLTASVETLSALTSGNDTVNGSLSDSISGDTIVDSSTTDSDVANIVITGAINPANMINVETVNATARFGSATLDSSKFTGTKTFNFDSTIANGNAEVTSNTATAVAAGTNISSLKVTNAAAGATTAVNGGAATSVTANGAAGADVFTIATAAGSSALAIDGAAGTDAYTVNMKGGTLALTGTNANNETLALNASTAAQTVNVTTGLSKITTVAGDQNVTIKGAAAVFDTFTITNSLAVGKTLDVVITSAAGAVDLSKVSATSISLEALNTSAKFAAAANVKLNTTDAGALNGTTSLNVDLLKATTGALTTDVATVNFTANTVAVTSLDAQLGAAATINIAGTKDVTLAATYTAKAVSAAGLSGVLTATAVGEANRVNITGGTANDKFTIGTVAAATTVVGGSGDDTVSIGTLANFKLTLDGGAGTGDMFKSTASTAFTGAESKTSVVTGFELVDIAAAQTLTFTQKQLFTNGNDFTVSGTGTLAIVDDALSSTVFDLGNLKFTPGVNTLTTIAGSTTVASTITGSASADGITGGSAADTINAGQGADTVTGAAGADKINVGAGIDTVVQGTGDSGTFAAPATNTISTTSFDIVTGMAAGDLIDLTDVARTVTSVSTLVGSGPANNTAVLVRGTYDAAANTFVGSAAGTDTLLAYDTDITAAVVLESIVLVGFVNTATATASATGVFTLA